MATRNPYWTYSDASTALTNYYYDDYTGRLSTPLSDNVATAPIVFGALSSTDVIDFIPVSLSAGREYMFSSVGTYPVELAIYDTSGYLLSYVDGADIGLIEGYN